MIEENIHRVDVYIAEHGQETGTVSWQMARDSFNAIKQELVRKSNIKRYLLFKGDDDSPEGGWRDFGGVYDTIDEAMRNTPTDPIGEWFQIVDTQAPEFRVAMIIAG